MLLHPHLVRCNCRKNRLLLPKLRRCLNRLLYPNWPNPFSRMKREGAYFIVARTEHDVIKFMVNALENIKPICEVEKVGIAGTIYDVPGIVARDRQQTLTIRWILEAAFKRRISYRISLEKCSFAEILDAYRKRGITR
ncbi:hypothetical protein M9H77_23616 [Catharanthus roseus]|uniref:Uncharacterized protein n=1 Tax=Catharanthus roseus TaxID=4058 RepID=A0ACC0AWM7_CATRO|nr:hypothetical protein M9H77_23616 [Catharanthus roseus]